MDIINTYIYDANTYESEVLGAYRTGAFDIYLSGHFNANLSKLSTPFLENSYIFDGAFCPYDDQPLNTVKIRIELYSYEDISNLASQRNEVFFKLLKNEYSLKNDYELIDKAVEGI